MNSIKIRTTQNVEVEYPLASVGDRIVAHLIDFAVYFIWMALWLLVQEGIGTEDMLFFFLIGVVPVVFYHLLCEIFLHGQSIGKMARDLKVIKLSGESPGIGDYLMRWVFRLIDTGISQGLLAVVTIAINNKGQRLGDMAAGTCVIRTKPVRRKEAMLIKTEEGYQVRFPEVNLLTDQDVALIRKLLLKAAKYRNYELVERMASRVREVTGIQQGELSDWDFLKTVVKDYHHYTHGEVEV